MTMVKIPTVKGKPSVPRIRNFTRPNKAEAPTKFWAFKAAGDGKAELTLYGEISDYTWWGDEVTPKAFKEELDALGDVSEIKVFFNSPGGDVFAGQAIRTMLKRHKAKIIGYVDGWAASIASVVLTACDIVIMPLNAMIMIHNPWTIAMGDATAFRKLADDLDQVRESIVVAYQEKTGLDRDEIIAMLDKETLLTAEEAVELGFADELEQSKYVAASMQDGYLSLNGQAVDIKGFKNVPKLVFAASAPTPSPAPAPGPAPDPEPSPAPPANNGEQQPNNGLLSLYQCKVQVNKNRRF